MEKKFSFIMPCFNDGNTIERAIKSIKDQDLSDIEMIVVNDGSTDNSKEILESLKESKFIDKLIHFEKNAGACTARNEGAKIAEGKYFSFLPADAFLYPGVARIWWNTLEEFSDYDFVYGGYRLVDDNDEPIPGQDLFFHPFEPYLLEVSNYIDGSFPIKKESYWKFAKIMNQSDGLWDPKVKSLQDWDFWLSVVKNGGKGVYVQDIFFETRMPHPGGLSFDSAENWLERTNYIKNKHKIPKRKLCVASLGASWHAKRLAYILKADFKEMPSFKPHEYDAIYVIGFYPEFADLQGKMFLNNYYDLKAGITAAKKVIHFVGTDIWQLYNCSLRTLDWYKNAYFKNIGDVKLLTEAEFTQEEMKKLGFETEIIPIPPLKLYEIKPLPKDFTVACYLPFVNRDFYRPNEMIEVAKKCPDIKFKFFGNPKQVGNDPALPDNIEYCGYITDMESFISECSAIMRFPIHDGLPISVLEFLLAGRYSVQNVPIKNTMFIPEFKVEYVIESLKFLKDVAKNGPNQTASDYWREELNHDKFVKKIKQLTDYDPKEYWENRAKNWIQQAKNMQVEAKEVKELFDEIKPKSILDLGCGDARWYPILQDWGIKEYFGIDIAEGLIKEAKLRFPQLEKKLQSCKIEDFKTKKKFDLIFSYTCFEHIKEEDWLKAVKAIKKMGKKLLLVEPINFISRYYCHAHDYEKDFKIIKKIQLRDKVALLCDLK